MTKKIQLICTVDTNDADYETDINTIDEETLDAIRPVLTRIAEIGMTWSWNIQDVRKKLVIEFGEELVERTEIYILIPEYGESNLEKLAVVITETKETFK